MTDGRCVVSSIPYPWPYHGHFDPARTALVACLDGTWRAPCVESDESDVRLEQLASCLQTLGGLVVVITRTPVRRGVLRDNVSGGRALCEPSGILSGADYVVTSGATSAFFASELDDVLRSNERDDLVIAGWGLEGPVHSTLRAANDRGYECLLVADASTPSDPELAFAACEMVRFSGGIFGAYTTTDKVLMTLDKESVVRRTS